MALSPGQLAALARGAGFSGPNVAIAVAVALAESSGNPTATNHNTDGSTDYGLWQINSSHLTELGLTPGQLFNPRTNAQAAFHVYQTQGWGAWTTYTSGAYQRYTQQGAQGAGSPQFAGLDLNPLNGFGIPGTVAGAAGGVLDTVAAPFNAIADAAKTIAHIFSFIFSVNFLYLIGGGILLVLAIILIARNQGVTR